MKYKAGVLPQKNGPHSQEGNCGAKLVEEVVK